MKYFLFVATYALKFVVFVAYNRGTFDNRDVAVKRVLLDYQRFADREVFNF